VVLEDLHWADPDTLDVVEYLADNLGDEAVLCVGTLRSAPPTPASELAGRLGSRGSAPLIDLGALDDAAVDAIVLATAPGTAGDDLARIRRSAEGVPFMVEELLGAPGVPRSFAETVRARVELLGPAQADVLVTAALLGRGIDWKLLDAAAGQPAGAVAQALEAGVGHGLLVSDAGEVRFRHALTRDALIATALPPRRAGLAARALAAVEAAHPELPGSWAGVAAELAVQSGAGPRAGELLAAAGVRALAQGALSTAAETLDRAAGLLPEGPLYFPADVRTDVDDDVQIAELVREKALQLTRDELPHAITVEVEEIVEAQVRAVIYVETESQKQIVVGRAGSVVREIGTRARPEVEALLGRRIYLELRVKARPKWRRDEAMLERLGI